MVTELVDATGGYLACSTDGVGWVQASCPVATGVYERLKSQAAPYSKVSVLRRVKEGESVSIMTWELSGARWSH